MIQLHLVVQNRNSNVGKGQWRGGVFRNVQDIYFLGKCFRYTEGFPQLRISTSTLIQEEVGRLPSRSVSWANWGWVGRGVCGGGYLLQFVCCGSSLPSVTAAFFIQHVIDGCTSEPRGNGRKTNSDQFKDFGFFSLTSSHKGTDF